MALVIFCDYPSCIRQKYLNSNKNNLTSGPRRHQSLISNPVGKTRIFPQPLQSSSEIVITLLGYRTWKKTRILRKNPGQETTDQKLVQTKIATPITECKRNFKIISETVSTREMISRIPHPS